MDKYALNEDTKVETKVKPKTKLNEDDVWASEPEPKDMVEYDNLRLDREAMDRYLEIRKAREENPRAKQGYHHSN